MPLDAMYQIRHLQMCQGEELYNIWHVERVSGATDSNAVGEIYKAVVLPHMRPMQNSLVTHINVECFNLADPEDVGGASLDSVAGTATTADLISKFNAHSFRLQRARRDMRHGFKRIAGPTEGQYTNGIPASGMVTLAGTFMSNVCTVNWVNATHGTVRPVVVKRIKYVTPSGKDGYRLPTSDEELKFYAVTSASFHGLTTQNSRKY